MIGKRRPHYGVAEIPPTKSVLLPLYFNINRRGNQFLCSAMYPQQALIQALAFTTQLQFGINASDFTIGDIKGSNLSIRWHSHLRSYRCFDKTTEESESFTIKLYTDWARTNIASDSISINDTSKTPAKPPIHYAQPIGS